MTVSTYRRFVAELIEKRTEQAHEPGFQVMDFEWDEEKRLTNIEKHGIDFIDADILFGNPHLVAPGAARSSA